MRLLALIGLLVALGSASAQDGFSPPAPEVAPKPRPGGLFPAYPAEDAWGRLPPPKNPALPEWAKVLAGPMPKTTARMLELDYLHREKNPLGARLAAQLRNTVATTLKCQYGRATSAADLPRGDPDAKALDAEALAIEFARQLTLDGAAITDEQFKVLQEHYEPDQVTAIVHTVAYANFHFRILLALGVKGESPPAPPVARKFDLDAARVKAPERPPWDSVKEVKSGGLSIRADWNKQEFADLNRTLGKQKERPLRIPMPDKSAFKDLVGREKQQAETIAWMTVSAGYQLEMTRAWFACLAAFSEEARLDRVFTNSVFWVVTRTNDCFY